MWRLDHYRFKRFDDLSGAYLMVTSIDKTLFSCPRKLMLKMLLSLIFHLLYTAVVIGTSDSSSRYLLGGGKLIVCNTFLDPSRCGIELCGRLQLATAL